MSFAEALRADHSLEACLDELGNALRALEDYPPTVVAVALRVHLEALLQALLESQVCSRAEVRAYLKELEHEALQYGED
jgi:hypothetical protein